MEIMQRLKQMERGAIRLHIGGAPCDTPGAARFGGAPDVPEGFRWPYFETATFDDDEINPRPLAFLAQFNCADLAEYDAEELLPSTGVLAFFYELGSQRWGFDPADGGCARVFWFEDAAALRPAEFPTELCEEYRLPALGIRMEREASLPGWEDFVVAHPENTNFDRFDAARRALGCEWPANRSVLLGWPDVIQNSMTCECELVGRGHYLGGGWQDIPQADKEDARTHSIEDWRLLFQLDTVACDGFELMFGDCGRIYFYIRREDLHTRRFDRVWLILQC